MTQEQAGTSGGEASMDHMLDDVHADYTRHGMNNAHEFVELFKRLKMIDGSPDMTSRAHRYLTEGVDPNNIPLHTYKQAYYRLLDEKSKGAPASGGGWKDYLRQLPEFGRKLMASMRGKKSRDRDRRRYGRSEYNEPRYGGQGQGQGQPQYGGPQYAGPQYGGPQYGAQVGPNMGGPNLVGPQGTESKALSTTPDPLASGTDGSLGTGSEITSLEDNTEKIGSENSIISEIKIDSGSDKSVGELSVNQSNSDKSASEKSASEKSASEKEASEISDNASDISDNFSSDKPISDDDNNDIASDNSVGSH